MSPDVDPIVSIIMPVKNEIRAIGKCIEGFRAQTFPLAEFEIVIADGSTDGTREILRGYEKEIPGWLRVFENPMGRIAEGYNIALRNARGKIVNGYVGHAFPAPDYIESVVRVLMEDDTDMVGGRVIPLPASGTLVARAIAASLQSPFTVGRNAFTCDTRCTTTSTHWMAVKRAMVDRIGEFNEDFARGEDCDWYERMIEAGARAVFDPRVRSFYFPRDTLGKQFVAQIHNGANRMKLCLATGRGMRFRHLLPLLLPLCWCGAGTLAFGVFPAVVSGGFVYAALLAGASVRIAGSQLRYLFCVSVATFLIHLGHGLGLIAGAMTFGAQSLMKLFKPNGGSSPRRLYSRRP